MFAFSPAQVMLGGSGFFFLQIHRVMVTTLSASDANKQCGCEVPTMVLSETRGLSLFLVVRGGIWLIKRLAVLEAHSPPNAVMDTHPRPERRKN